MVQIVSAWIGADILVGANGKRAAEDCIQVIRGIMSSLHMGLFPINGDIHGAIDLLASYSDIAI